MLVHFDLQRLTRVGMSTAVTIRKPVMRHLGWLPGQTVIVEVMDDDTIRIRKPTLADLGPQIPRARPLPIPIEAK